jgi:hypothetical protein
MFDSGAYATSSASPFYVSVDAFAEEFTSSDGSALFDSDALFFEDEFGDPINFGTVQITAAYVLTGINGEASLGLSTLPDYLDGDSDYVEMIDGVGGGGGTLYAEFTGDLSQGIEVSLFASAYVSGAETGSSYSQVYATQILVNGVEYELPPIVPEPSSVVLASLGGLGLLAFARRRRRRA